MFSYIGGFFDGLDGSGSEVRIIHDGWMYAPFGRVLSTAQNSPVGSG